MLPTHNTHTNEPEAHSQGYEVWMSRSNRAFGGVVFLSPQCHPVMETGYRERVPGPRHGTESMFHRDQAAFLLEKMLED